MLTGQGRTHHGDILREATKLAAEGVLTPPLDPRRFILKTVLDVHRAVESASADGKIVVDAAT